MITFLKNHLSSESHRVEIKNMYIHGFWPSGDRLGRHRKSIDLIEYDVSIFMGVVETFSLRSYEGLKLLDLRRVMWHGNA